MNASTMDTCIEVNSAALKLRQKDRKRLEGILDHLERSQTFLLDQQTLVCRRSSAATTTLHLTNQKGDVCYSIDKEIGSPLAMLHGAIADLRKVLS